MKKIFILFCLMTSIHGMIAQTIIEDENLSLEIVKARKIGVLSVQFSNDIFINSGKDDKRVQIRLKVRSLNEELTPLDPNKISLVVENPNVRFSVSQAQFATFFRTRGFRRLTTNPSEEPKSFSVTYDPTIRNTFDDFSKSGYTDIPISLNFGTKRKPSIHTIYFKPGLVDKNVLDVYFVVPNEIKSGDVYYGEQLISNIKFR